MRAASLGLRSSMRSMSSSGTWEKIKRGGVDRNPEGEDADLAEVEGLPAGDGRDDGVGDPAEVLPEHRHQLLHRQRRLLLHHFNLCNFPPLILLRNWEQEIRREGGRGDPCRRPG